MKKLSLILILCVLVFSAKAQLNASHHQKIDSLVQDLYNQGKLHGGILIAEGEKVIYQSAYGLADKNLGIANSTNTRFVINSMGKMFTAILTLQLVEDDSIALEDPISKHLPWFKHPRANEITIHHLLSHRSGLKGYFLEQIEGRLNFFVSQREVLESMAKQELNFDPGSGFDYSNTGYLLLGEIIMKYRHDDYYAIQQNRIFSPLGMTSTYNSTSIYGPGSPVYYSSDGSAFLPFPHNNYKGDGGAKSSLADLHRFMQAVGSEKLLKKESWDVMFEQHSLPSEATRPFGAHFFPYGYGCSSVDLPYNSENDEHAVFHGGAGYGSSNVMIRYPSKNRIIIVWNNKFVNPMPEGLLKFLASISD